jgi:Haemolysin secretion/activation protein ShlB/FhaC/HecB
MGWVRESRLRLEPNRHLLLRMRGLLVARETPAAGLTWRSPMLGEGVAANAIGSAADTRFNTMPGAVGDLLHTVRDGAPAPEGRLPVSDGSVPDPLSPDGALDYRFSMGPRRTVNGRALQAVEFTTAEKAETGDVDGTVWLDAEGRPVWAVMRGRGGTLADRTWVTPGPFTRTLAPAQLEDATIALGYYDGTSGWRMVQLRAEAPLHVTSQVRWVESRWRERSESVPPPQALLDHVHARYDDRLRPSLGHLAVRAVTNLRYNLVEGLSTAVAPAWDVSPWVLVGGSFRKGTTSYGPSWSVEVSAPYRPLRFGVEAYRRIEDANPWGKGLRHTNSIRALLFGSDEGKYFTTRGATGWLEWVGEWSAVRLEAFAEHDSEALPRTDFTIFGDTVGSSAGALLTEEADLLGVRLSVERQVGLDTRTGVAVFRGFAGGVAGDFDYLDVGGSVDLARRLVGPVLGGLRVAVASKVGGPPNQRQYFVGGTRTVRGFKSATAQGEAFWFARAELAAGWPLFRAVIFSDAGWADRHADLFSTSPLVSAGAGVSFLDGWFRVDVARAVHPGNGFRLHFYANGLL